jgi:hypothetical protein
MPVVPWAHDTTVRPSAGPGLAPAAGAMTTPDTATGWPSTVVDRYSTSKPCEPLGPANGRAQITSPGWPAGRGSGGV